MKRLSSFREDLKGGRWSFSLTTVNSLGEGDEESRIWSKSSRFLSERREEDKWLFTGLLLGLGLFDLFSGRGLEASILEEAFNFILRFCYIFFLKGSLRVLNGWPGEM